MIIFPHDKPIESPWTQPYIQKPRTIFVEKVVEKKCYTVEKLDDRLAILVRLAGHSKNNISVTTDKSLLTVKSVCKLLKERVEFSISIEGCDPSTLKANFKDGLLTISILYQENKSDCVQHAVN